MVSSKPQNPKTSVDPYALEIARAVQKSVRPHQVILFGSRAAGDHREDSDVDLMVITKNVNKHAATEKGRIAAQEYMRQKGHILEISILPMDQETFHQCRHAAQHIAAQALIHGVNMSGENLEYQYNQQPEEDVQYPTHWPATRQFLQDCESWTRELDEMDDEDHWNKKMIGFAAEQAIENAIKSWLSHHQDSSRYRHDLEGAWNKLTELEKAWSSEPNTPEEHRFLANEASSTVEELLQHTTFQGTDEDGNPYTGNWLSLYGATYRYGTPVKTLVREDHHILREKVDHAVAAIIEVIHQRNRTQDADVWPDGIKPWA